MFARFISRVNRRNLSSLAVEAMTDLLDRPYIEPGACVLGSFACEPRPYPQSSLDYFRHSRQSDSQVRKTHNVHEMNPDVCWPPFRSMPARPPPASEEGERLGHKYVCIGAFLLRGFCEKECFAAHLLNTRRTSDLRFTRAIIIFSRGRWKDVGAPVPKSPGLLRCGNSMAKAEGLPL